MNREAMIQKIKDKACQDARKRRDRRYLDTMGFLVAKGFLRVNQPITLLPNKRLRIKDAIWAGENVEPRILEVLPAAVLRLGRHFDLDPTRHKELARVIEQLKAQEKVGNDFCEMPYVKIKQWVEFPLLDRRVKTVTKKKVVKTFRLEPAAVAKLRSLAEERGCTETEVLERLLNG